MFSPGTPFQIFKHVRRFNTSVTCKPGERFPSETSCAKYVECASSGKSKSSMVERECPCPQLYDITTQKCSHYSNVRCETGVFEPKSPCKFVEDSYCLDSARNLVLYVIVIPWVVQLYEEIIHEL